MNLNKFDMKNSSMKKSKMILTEHSQKIKKTEEKKELRTSIKISDISLNQENSKINLIADTSEQQIWTQLQILG